MHSPLATEWALAFPLRITFRDVERSNALEARVRRHADKLGRFDERIVACCVAIEAPHRHKHHGRHYRVRVDLAVPGADARCRPLPRRGARARGCVHRGRPYVRSRRAAPTPAFGDEGRTQIAKQNGALPNFARASSFDLISPWTVMTTRRRHSAIAARSPRVSSRTPPGAQSSPRDPLWS
jgi:sigma 54 modulation/S30EA-like ribosomal protein